MPQTEADMTLSDGREVVFNLKKMSRQEYRDLHNPAYTDENDDVVIAKVTGIDIEELRDMNMEDYSRLIWQLIRKVQQPTNPT
jgi:hypothetical protein